MKPMIAALFVAVFVIFCLSCPAWRSSVWTCPGLRETSGIAGGATWLPLLAPVGCWLGVAAVLGPLVSS
jgi:hypothetical protein